MSLPDNWTTEDIELLLRKLDRGVKVLVSDTRLGIPTVHDLRDPRHCGHGLFVAETPEYEVEFCGGSALDRTPSGNGWCVLNVRRGEYPYDADAVRETLSAYLARNKQIKVVDHFHAFPTADPGDVDLGRIFAKAVQTVFALNSLRREE